MERLVHLAAAVAFVVSSTMTAAANTSVVRIISSETAPTATVSSGAASTSTLRIITSATPGLVHTIAAAKPSQVGPAVAMPIKPGAGGANPESAATPALRIIDGSSDSSCPQGTYLSAPHQSEIRRVGQSQDQVISTPVPRSCTTKPIRSAQLPAYVTTAMRSPPPKGPRKRPEEDPATNKCVAQAAQALGVQPTALFLILEVEGGTLGRVSQNTNGTYDIGPAQINSIWLPTLAKQGINEDQLTNDLCINILASAWIYSKGRRRADSVTEAIALYHSPTPVYQKRYLKRIGEAVERRLADLSPSH